MDRERKKKEEKDENEKEKLEKEKRKKEEIERIEKERERLEKKEKEKEEEEKKKAEEIVKVGQKQLVMQQAQIKILLEEKEVRMSQIFDGTLSKVSIFVENCRRYIERKMKGEKTEDKIYWIVSYVQEGLTDK